MQKTAQKIKKAGLNPGIWLAPLLTDAPTLHRLRTFPFKFILDLENPKIFNRALDSIKTIVEKWRFSMLKLDFLYALHFLPRYKDSAVPNELLRSFLSAVKKLYPHIHLNVCGCPLGPAVGIADSMRTSADIVNPYLDHIWPINKIFHSQRLNQLETSLNFRLSSASIWLLDPDAFVCRQSLGLSPSQIFKLQSLIKKANGVYFLGDDLTRLNELQIQTYIQPLFLDIAVS